MTDVLMAGSNPCIFLYGEASDPLSALSYWDVHFSPVGSGKCLFVNSSQTGNIALADNETLLDFVHLHFNRHFDGFKKVDEGQLHREKATFTATLRPSENRLGLEAVGATVAIAAAWDGLKVAEQLIDELTGFGPRSDDRFRVASVIVPATSVHITVNNAHLPGKIRPMYGKLKSSAFLALGESWSRLN